MNKWEEVKKAPPHDKVIWVRVIAHIRKNSTGEVRQYETQEIMDEGQDKPNNFNWAENNYSCDCNREIFFERAIGKEIEDRDNDCGHGKFSVNLQNPVTGDFYYTEFK